MIVVDVGERHGVVLSRHVKVFGFNKAVGFFWGKFAELVAGDKATFTQQGLVDVFERRVEGTDKLDAKAVSQQSVADVEYIYKARVGAPARITTGKQLFTVLYDDDGVFLLLDKGNE